jgi:hypothetical protein
MARGRGSGGRATFGGRSTSTKPQERELKFAPILNQGKNATYATTREALIQLIEKTYRGGADVGKSLDDMKVLDLDAEAPIRTLSRKLIPMTGQCNRPDLIWSITMRTGSISQESESSVKG